MKYLFVGDLHGRHEVIDRAVEKKADRIIFLGDIFDSFDRTVEDQFKTFRKVVDLVTADKAECVWGNHEWSYFDPRMRCSGFDPATFVRRGEFEPIVRSLFKPYLYLEDSILVTHAGLTDGKWTKEDISLLKDMAKDIGSPFFDIGYVRGGYRGKIGGPLWCDFRHEFKPVPDLIQVFGHTHGQGIRSIGTNYCVDCVDNTDEFLIMDL